MQTIETIAEVREAVAAARRESKTVGLVPTMGFLHDGHMRLVDTARQENDLVVVSIFVNPLQFGPNEDFDRYPRDAERDQAMLAEHGCDIVFMPSVDEMYPRPPETVIELPRMSETLCGRSRPGHFRGVAMVVSKLLHIVQPDRAYFGRKDAQQAAIIQRLVEDLNMPVQIVTVPTVRDADGLAKSSRNVYLTPEERRHATVLYRSLNRAKEAILAGERSTARLVQDMRATLEAEPGVRLDYADIVSLSDLQPMDKLEGEVLLAVAAYVGKTRLIDNLQMNVTETHATLI
ncbi:pantoate--beta-alanine ligase [Alicyclobacillus shizuokensis]|uniref:pantoate--beta-alanine ligase n=1 Tax=Alicyclobacillus shizuokensis TaxID=392014 RepID=UPI0008298963|nr:pantoate--beta-alanine ligase [Alicyclobacillus shizuokensis]MCL6627567.1 pantoate--beta-alanine ligase [Alicyclobacillus shizuokensis]